MADPRLVWRQLAAPDFTGASRILENAGKSLDRGFAAAGGVVERYKKGQQENADNALLADLAKIKNEKEFDNYLAGGGLNNSNISPDLRKHVLGMREGFVNLVGKRASNQLTKDNNARAWDANKRFNNADARKGELHGYRVGEIKDNIARRDIERGAAGRIGNHLAKADEYNSDLPPGAVGVGAGESRAPGTGKTTTAVGPDNAAAPGSVPTDVNARNEFVPTSGENEADKPNVTFGSPIDFTGPKADDNRKATAAAKALTDPTRSVAGGSRTNTTANNSNWTANKTNNVSIVGNYGPKSRASAKAAGRGPEANAEIRNLAANAAEAVFGPGTKIIVNSGFRTKGAAKGRHPEGKAMDIVIVDPDGKTMNINDPRMREFVMVGGAMGMNSVGAGQGYMGQYAIHIDTATHGTPGHRAWAALGNSWEGDFNRVRKEGYTYNGVYYNRAGNSATGGGKVPVTREARVGASDNLVSAPPPAVPNGPQGDTRAFNADVDSALGLGPGTRLDPNTLGPGISLGPDGKFGLAGNLPNGLGRENSVGVPTDPVAAAVARATAAQNAATPPEDPTTAGIVPPIPEPRVASGLGLPDPTTGGTTPPAGVTVAGDGTVTNDPTAVTNATIEQDVAEAERATREAVEPLTKAPDEQGNSDARRNFVGLKAAYNQEFQRLAASGRHTVAEIQKILAPLQNEIDQYEKKIRADEERVNAENSIGLVQDTIDAPDVLNTEDIRQKLYNDPRFQALPPSEQEKVLATAMGQAERDPNRVANAGIQADPNITNGANNLTVLAEEKIRSTPVGQMMSDSDAYKGDGAMNQFFKDLQLDDDATAVNSSFWDYIGIPWTEDGKFWKNELQNKINSMSRKLGVPREIVMIAMKEKFRRNPFFQNTQDRTFREEDVTAVSGLLNATNRTLYREKRQAVTNMQNEFAKIEKESREIRQEIYKRQLANPSDPKIAELTRRNTALYGRMSTITAKYRRMLELDDNKTPDPDRTNAARDGLTGRVGTSTPFQ